MSREAATRSSWRARPSCALLLCILFFCVLAQPALATTPPAPAPLEMVVLGSGGPGASARAGAAYVLLMDGEPRILVDAGPGSLVRLGEAKLDIRQLDTVLLTHLHADHAAELPGIVKARAVSARTDIGFHVFGPAGAQGDGDVAARFPSTSGFVERLFGKSGAFAYLADFAGTIDFTTSDLFPLGDSDPSREPRVIHRIGDLVISAVAGHHRDAPAVIYRVDYKGKRITFSGDIDAQGHAALTRIAKGADLLVFNAVVLDPRRLSAGALRAAYLAGRHRPDCRGSRGQGSAAQPSIGECGRVRARRRAARGRRWACRVRRRCGAASTCRSRTVPKR